MMRIVVYIFLLSFIFFQSIVSVYQQRTKFFSKGYMQQFHSYEQAYFASQYVKKNSISIMPDETFESYVGGAFLRGKNPIMIVHEHPPIGRYIIALSILLFDNPSTIILPLLVISLIGIWLISKQVLHSTILSLIPIAIFANEPLFLHKLSFTPLLEPIQLPFIVLSIYFFIQGVTKEKHNKWFILSSLMLGFVISIRFFILGLFLTISFILYFLLQKPINKRIFPFILSLPLSLVVLVLGYTRTMQDGYTVLQIFSVQKYILFYHKSKLINEFTFWDLLFFNRWHTWWADRRIISDSEWIIIWPITMFFSFLFTIENFFKRLAFSKAEKVIILWVIAYCLLLSIGSTTTRYFLPLVPFLYILSVRFLQRVLEKR